MYNMESTGMSVRSKLMLMLVLGITVGVFFLLPLELGTVVNIGVVVVMVAIMVMLTLNLMKTAADPIERMNKTVTALTEGKMEVNLRADAAREAGEVGVLESNLAKLAISQHNFLGDLDTLSKKASAGEALSTLDVKNYPGGQREVANHINAVISSYEKLSAGLITVFEAFARGDFSPNVTGTYPKITEAVDKLGKQLKTLKTDTQNIAQAAKDGKLTTRTGGSYNGEWSKISADLNATLESLARPVSDITAAVERLESGSFSTGVSGNMQGDFEKIKNSLEKINALYGGNLSELASALNDISFGRTHVSMNRDYRGSFQQVQSAVQSVARSTERLADDVKRAQATAAARPATTTTPTTAARPGGLMNTTTTATPPRTPTTPLRTATPAPRPNPTPAPRPTASAPAPRSNNVTTPPLPVNSGKVNVPSGAHEYNRKDFGKYK